MSKVVHQHTCIYAHYVYHIASYAATLKYIYYLYAYHTKWSWYNNEITITQVITPPISAISTHNICHTW